MKNRAFTLIELLVVVLIIGILAAIALPQYRIAVQKARAAQDMVSVNGIVTALKDYHLANNTWPSSLNDLGITIPTNCSGWKAGTESTYYNIACSFRYRIQLNPSGNVSERYCLAAKDNDLQNKVCKALTGNIGTTLGDNYWYNYR